MSDDYEPVEGSAEDFLVEVQSELGASLRSSVLQYVSIDDHKLVQEAEELPQLLFYYNAALQRTELRLQKSILRLKKRIAEVKLEIREKSKAVGDTLTLDEVECRITLNPEIDTLRHQIAELEIKRETVKAVVSSLTRKGYSLQLVANIRSREEDWLRTSFYSRLQEHPRGNEIIRAMQQALSQIT